MNTRKLYQQDVELRSCDSTILSVVCDQHEMETLGAKKEKSTFLIVLDQTVFFPEGGGQPCDLGFIGSNPVCYVFEREGIVYHQTSSPSGEPPIASASPVSCSIHWPRRFLHMQQHCGEHILSGMFYQEYGGVNRGFHMGDGYMTIDIHLEENPEFTEFTPEMIDRVELLANQAIWSNVPVVTRHYDTREETAGLPLRKALTIERDITVVCVGNPENPADCVACCGTHPKTAGQVGLVKLLKAEAYKGMTRFTVKAGQPAFADYALKHGITTRLCNQFSSGIDDLLEKMKVQETKNGAVRKELYDLKKSLLAQQAAQLRELYQTTSFQQPTPIVVKRYDYLSIDDLQTLGRQVTPFIQGLLLLVAEKEHTVLLLSQGKPDCGRLVKENAAIYQGKGGGNPTLARAIFSKAENLDIYLELLEKHLR